MSKPEALYEKVIRLKLKRMVAWIDSPHKVEDSWCFTVKKTETGERFHICCTKMSK